MEKPRLLIGLTGACCAGKNHIARLLDERGVPALDVDKLGHKVIEIEKKAILGRFGEEILNPDGTVNRKALGAKVFGKPEELAALEAIVHPGVNRLTDEWIAAQRGSCVINAALLHRSTAFGRLDAVILVEAPLLVRFLRAGKRDRLPLAALIRRFKSQEKFNSQYSIKNTDIYRVENRDCFASRRGEEKLKNRIDEILSRLGIG